MMDNNYIESHVNSIGDFIRLQLFPYEKTNVNDPENSTIPTKLQACNRSSSNDTPVTPNDIIVKIVTATIARDIPIRQRQTY